MLVNEDLFRTDIPKAAKNILCLIPYGLSTAILTTPSLSALRQYYSQARITVIGPQECETLFRDTGLIDRLWTFSQTQQWHNLEIYFSLFIETFDFFIDFYTPFMMISDSEKPVFHDMKIINKNLIIKLITNPKKSIGFSINYNRNANFIQNWLQRRFRFSVNIPKPKQDLTGTETISDLTLELLIDRKKINIAAPLFRKTIYNPRKNYEDTAAQTVLSNKQFICLYFGGSHESMHWPTEHVVSFCKKITTNLDVSVHIIGGPEELRYAETISKQLSQEIKEGSVVNHMHQISLENTMNIISQASLMISTLGGPFHIADAYDIPIITLATSSVPKVNLACRESRQILLQIPVECSPCFRSKCNQSVSCMEQITPVQVVEAVHAMVADRYSHVNQESGTGRKWF